MFTDTAAIILRQTDRRRLLAHLVKLGDENPERRANAALAATELLQGKGLSWEALVPDGRDDTAAVPPRNWRAKALELAEHPGLTPAERNDMLKIAGWKSPGRDGMSRFQAIAERVGAMVGSDS